ncbi:MAG: GAF domain-containing protein [Alphaproteobacteria bacterium]|nr:GAF domain-containing protein [Alphaproteobacteria bacterium]
MKLSNVRIAGKLYGLILIAMVGMVGIASMSQYQIGKVFDLANYATINTVPSFITLYDVQNRFLRIRIDSRDHVMNTDDIKMSVLDGEIKEEREGIARGLNYYEEKLVSDPEDLKLLGVVRSAFREYYIGLLDPVLLLSRQNKNVDARDILEKNRSLVDKVEQALKGHIEYNNKLAQSGSAEAMAAKNMAFWVSIGMTVLMLMFISLFGWILASRQLARPIGVVVETLKQLADGSLNVTVDGIERRDEVGDIARAAQVFKEFAQKLDTESWIKSHTSEIGAALQRAEDLRELAQTAISRLAPVIGAGHGAVYVMDGERRFNLLGSYGYRERKSLNNSFLIGEGLVGQAAMEKAPITLRTPQDYIQINSGLGEGPPACVAVLPILHQEHVLGVLEVASFQQFSDREVALLDAVMPVLATSMEIMNRNQRTRELLTATQEQAERMEKQAAQLEEQSVEMEAQQAELLETENWFRSIIESAPDGLLVVEESGAIVLSNPQAETLFGYGTGEMIGLNVDLLVPNTIRAGHGAHRQKFLTENRSRILGDRGGISGVRKDSTEFPLTLTLSPLPVRGNRGRCVSVSMRAVTAGV